MKWLELLMPLYEYFCPDCKVKFEVQKPMAERKLALCTHCGQSSRIVMSPFSFTFGWTLSDRSHERFGPKDEFVRNV